MPSPSNNDDRLDLEETLVESTIISPRRHSAIRKAQDHDAPGEPQDIFDHPSTIWTAKSKFRIDEQIGSGGMGIVWKGFDLTLHRPVAIKALHPRFLSQLQVVRRFQMEALIIGALRHPNIVQVYEVVDDDKSPMIIMEYVEGHQLDHVIRDTGAAMEQLVGYLITICDALGFAHSRGILHRDIKPGNIMITSEGHPKIMDFGIAKRLLETDFQLDTEKTTEGMILGSPSFMSPEQASGGQQNLDTRADIYSLGGTIYHALTGKAPIRGESAIEAIDAVLNWQPPPPSHLNQSLPIELDSICMKALEKNPDNRYQSAREMSDDLRRFRAGMPVLAHPYRFTEKVARAISHEKRVFAIAVIVAIAMFAGIVYAVSTLYHVSRASLIQELREKVMGIAATAALMIDPVVVERVRTVADKETLEFRQLVRLLKNIKAQNERVEFVWIMRKSSQHPGYSEFVAENDLLDSFEELDKDHDGILAPHEQRVEPGMLYKESLDFPQLAAGYINPTADHEIEQLDQWGVSLSGYAPIRDFHGNSIAVLGVDMRLGQVYESFILIDRAYHWILIIAAIATIVFIGIIVLWITSQWSQKAYSLKPK